MGSPRSRNYEVRALSDVAPRARETAGSIGRIFSVAKTMAVLAIWLSLIARAQASTLAPGLYATSSHTIYVGVEHELPDPTSNDFFDPASQRTGDLHAMNDLHLRSGISEERRVIESAQGRLGLSLYYAGDEPRATRKTLTMKSNNKCAGTM